MKALSKPSIASSLAYLLKVASWLAASGLVLLTLLLGISLFIDIPSDKVTIDLPVAVSLQPPLQGNASAFGADAQLEKLRGNLRFPAHDRAFVSGGALLGMALLSFVLWLMNQLRQIFRSLAEGLVFIPDNVRRIRRVGYAMIFGELARAALVLLCSYYSSLHFTVNGLHFVASADLSFITLAGGFTVLVVAEVFREGMRLSEEQSLTI
jgi:hypothetical protein